MLIYTSNDELSTLPRWDFGTILYNMTNLTKYISSCCGAVSRREADKLIRSGCVSVNGVVESNPAYRVVPGDVVVLSGKVLTPAERHHYILLHKPRGYVCSNSDVHAEHLAVDLITVSGVRLVSAGRLDKDSEGAIIFSDDGDFINFLAHPRYEVLKKYLVTVNRPLKSSELTAISCGIEDDGEFLQVRSVRPSGSPNEYEFILNEGKKREIRRLVAACGAKVIRLIRVSIGGVVLGDLPAGEFRELSDAEIDMLYGRR